MAAREEYNFYYCTLSERVDGVSALGPSGFRLEKWVPAWWRLMPASLVLLRGSPIGMRHLVYFWGFYYLSRFRGNPTYAIYLFFRGDKLAHFSIVRSRDFRFPFMRRQDLQVGPVWTHPDHRRKGLAAHILLSVMNDFVGLDRRCWWVCLRSNINSNLVADHAKMTHLGRGWRKTSVGLRILGTFCIQRSVDDVDAAHDFTIITESPDDQASSEQLSILYTRYHFALTRAKGKHVLEVACGAGMGLGYLAGEAAQVTGGDIDYTNYRRALEIYKGRPHIVIERFDAQDMPFSDSSFDVVILFEAIYYLPNLNGFLRETQRVLRPGGKLLISSVNCKWPGFNPSAYSHKYYSGDELVRVLEANEFKTTLFAGFPDHSNGLFESVLRLARRVAIRLHLIPRSMKGKSFLKRVVYGKLIAIPREISEGMAGLEPLIEIANGQSTTPYKMLYAVACRRAK